MKKNLFDADAKENLINRVEMLQAGSTPLWGKMNATEMLLHCNSCNQEILKEERRAKKTSLKQLLLRWLALYIAPHFMKGIQSELHHVTKGKIASSQFCAQKETFIQLIRQMHATQKSLTLTHPAFGNISTNEWGIAAYKHMDHHLRQFGV